MTTTKQTTQNRSSTKLNTTTPQEKRILLFFIIIFADILNHFCATQKKDRTQNWKEKLKLWNETDKKYKNEKQVTKREPFLAIETMAMSVAVKRAIPWLFITDVYYSVLF